MIYLDNAATTHPKPQSTKEAVMKYFELTANPGRGGHQLSVEAARRVWAVREHLARFLGSDSPEEIIFTASATFALNLAIFGILQPGDHFLISALEHNATARPAYYLKSIGIDFDIIPVEGNGLLDPDAVPRLIKPNTKLVATIHASNVTGGIMPIQEIGRICREKEVVFLVDAAQTAGLYPVDVKEMNVDLLAFSGHKNLYGVAGIGGLLIRKGIKLRPLCYGGTGTISESMDMPDSAPERYEAGTLNSLGIAALAGGLNFIREIGREKLWQHESALTQHLLKGLKELEQVKVYGPGENMERMPVVSFTIENHDASEVGFILDQVYGIAVRTGLHCAPLAHKTLGVLEKGTVRVSFSYFNSLNDVEKLLAAIKSIIKEKVV